MTSRYFFGSACTAAYSSRASSVASSMGIAVMSMGFARSLRRNQLFLFSSLQRLTAMRVSHAFSLSGRAPRKLSIFLYTRMNVSCTTSCAKSLSSKQDGAYADQHRAVFVHHSAEFRFGGFTRYQGIACHPFSSSFHLSRRKKSRKFIFIWLFLQKFFKNGFSRAQRARLAEESKVRSLTLLFRRICAVILFAPA